MTRSELVSNVAESAGITLKEADRIIRVITDIITTSMAGGERITIAGFGTFEKKLRKATIARNPQTGENMSVSAQNMACFRAGTALKQAIKQQN